MVLAVSSRFLEMTIRINARLVFNALSNCVCFLFFLFRLVFVAALSPCLTLRKKCSTFLRGVDATRKLEAYKLAIFITASVKKTFNLTRNTNRKLSREWGHSLRCLMTANDEELGYAFMHDYACISLRAQDEEIRKMRKRSSPSR